MSFICRQSRCSPSDFKKKFYPKLKLFSFVSNHSDYTLPGSKTKESEIKSQVKILQYKTYMELSAHVLQAVVTLYRIAFHGATTEKLSGIV